MYWYFPMPAKKERKKEEKKNETNGEVKTEMSCMVVKGKSEAPNLQFGRSSPTPPRERGRRHWREGPFAALPLSGASPPSYKLRTIRMSISWPANERSDVQLNLLNRDAT